MAVEQAEAGPGIGATVVEPDRLEHIRNVQRQRGQARRSRSTPSQENGPQLIRLSTITQGVVEQCRSLGPSSDWLRADLDPQYKLDRMRHPSANRATP